MALSALALTWLCLAQSPAPALPPPTYLSHRDIKIPIEIEPARRAELKELVLYVSDDEGKSWNKAASVTSDKTHFPFNAPHDGVYWFNVGIIDLQGKEVTPNPYTVQPAQVVVVDVQNPDIKVTSATRVGDEATVSWQIQEDHPKLDTLKLEYRPADTPAYSTQWYTVPLTQPALVGSQNFRLNVPGAVTVRLELTDQARNVNHAEAQLPPGPAPVTAPPPHTPDPPAPPPAVVATPPTGVAAPAASPSPIVGTAPITTTAPAPPTAVIPSSALVSTPGYPASDRPPPPVVREPPPFNPPATSPGAVDATGPQGTQLVAAGGPDIPGTVPPTVAHMPHGPLPALQITNDPHIVLEYEVSQTGLSGVGKVELWVTPDDGATWKYLTDDPDCKSPITATLPGEGIFGLRLVVQSGANQGKGPPQAGDAPEMRIEVDTTAPRVGFYEPKADSAQRDTLILSWKATDRNLTPRPITLEYAEEHESRPGPWQVIAADLPNTGSYSWVPKSQVKSFYVYLRISAVDTAGNRTTVSMPAPFLVDLNKPEGRLVKIVSQGKLTPAPAPLVSSPPPAPPPSPVVPAGGQVDPPVREPETPTRRWAQPPRDLPPQPAPVVPETPTRAPADTPARGINFEQ